MPRYLINIWASITTLITGLLVTWKHMLHIRRDNVTLQYPEERWPQPDRYIGFDHDDYNIIRTRLQVDIDDCIGCLKCQRACPVDCIKIDTVKLPKETKMGSLPGSTQTSTTSSGSPKRLLVARFDIDLAECMYCNLCTYPCPEECIFMVGGPNGHRHPIDYEFAERNRNRLVYQFATATDEEVEQVSRLAGVPDPRQAREERRAKYHGEAVDEEVAVAVAVAVAEPAPAPAAATKKAPEKTPKKKGAGEKEIDLAVLNAISDRMARSKAKAILNKTLRQGSCPKDAAQEIRATLKELGKLDGEVEAILARLEK